jgi:hypothetical protein
MYIFMDVSHIIFLPISSSYSEFVKFGGITIGTISKDLYQCNVLWVSKGLVDVFFQDAHCFEELLLVRVPMTLKNVILHAIGVPFEHCSCASLLVVLLLLFLP